MNWGAHPGDPETFYALGENGRRYRVKRNKHGGDYWYADEWRPDMRECFDMFRKGTKDECVAWCERRAKEKR